MAICRQANDDFALVQAMLVPIANRWIYVQRGEYRVFVRASVQWCIEACVWKQIAERENKFINLIRLIIWLFASRLVEQIITFSQSLCYNVCCNVCHWPTQRMQITSITQTIYIYCQPNSRQTFCGRAPLTKLTCKRSRWRIKMIVIRHNIDEIGILIDFLDVICIKHNAFRCGNGHTQ